MSTAAAQERPIEAAAKAPAVAAEPVVADRLAHTRRHRLLSRLLPSRTRLDDSLDGLRLRVDTFPYRVYQPLPWLGLESATRAGGTASRFEAMLPVLEDLGVESAVDLGCNVGWYVLRLAERGIATIGVEFDPPLYRTALLATRRSGIKNVAVQVMEITPETAQLLPTADATLMLSIWHHFVRDYGLDEATAILRTAWEHTARVLIFDTGEAEMGPDFGLPPLAPDSRTWLEGYLGETCAPCEVLHLGLHAAFGPDGRPCRRNLFAVVRRS